MKNIKKIAKYITNVLAIINALLLGLAPIWNIPMADEITKSITVVIGVIGMYLLGDKAISSQTSKNEELYEGGVDEDGKGDEE